MAGSVWCTSAPRPRAVVLLLLLLVRPRSGRRHSRSSSCSNGGSSRGARQAGRPRRHLWPGRRGRRRRLRGCQRAPGLAVAAAAAAAPPGEARPGAAAAAVAARGGAAVAVAAREVPAGQAGPRLPAPPRRTQQGRPLLPLRRACTRGLRAALLGLAAWQAAAATAVADPCAAAASAAAQQLVLAALAALHGGRCSAPRPSASGAARHAQCLRAFRPGARH